MALSTVACLILGTAYGAVRSPSYTADSYLYVGQTLSLVNTAAIPGLSAAATTEAQDYSRLITTPSVTAAVAKAMGHTAGDLGGSLDASVIAETPEIVVTATASSAAHAVTLANAGAAGLVGAVDNLNLQSAAALGALKASYAQLTQESNEAQLRETQLQSELAAAVAGAKTAKAASLRTEVATVQTQISLDNLNAATAENQYSTSYSPLVAEEEVLKTESPAVTAKSNRKTSIELGVIGGLFGGLLIGVTGASFLDLRADRRRFGRRQHPRLTSS